MGINMNRKVIVFDIDGTVANIEHRRHFVQSKPRNWPAFNKAMVNDKPYPDIVWLVQLFAAQEDCIVLLASGRGEEDRQKTLVSLDVWNVPFEKLYMRPAKDSRQDSIIKREILAQITAEFGRPFMVFDDRNQVVEMWRAEGIRCLQVAPGDF